MSKEDLTNYVASHVLDPLSRVNGVGQTLLLGSQFSMRIWLDPVKLTNYSLTPTDNGWPEGTYKVVLTMMDDGTQRDQKSQEITISAE